MKPESNLQRLFLAFELPDAVKAALSAVQQELKGSLPKGYVGWSRPETMHLTLCFLGNVPEEQTGPLQVALAPVLSAVPEMVLRCERLGCFPDLRFPRVLWARVQGEQLEEVQSRIREASEGFRATAEPGRFTGHVTLGRFRKIGRRDVEQIASVIRGHVDRQFGTWRAKEVVLFRSELLPAGARHQRLKIWQLAGGV